MYRCYWRAREVSIAKPEALSTLYMAAWTQAYGVNLHVGGLWRTIVVCEAWP